MHRDPAAETEFHRIFGRRVRAARTEAAMTQARLCELLEERGIVFTPSAIARIESGEREPRLNEALAIADVLGFSLSSLTGSIPDLAVLEADIKRLSLESTTTLQELVRAVNRLTDRLGGESGRPAS